MAIHQEVDNGFAKCGANAYTTLTGEKKLFRRFLLLSKQMDDVTCKRCLNTSNRISTKDLRNPYKVGQILHYSWGYDQTNCEFYQVTEVTKGTVTIRQIGTCTVDGSEGFMSDSRVPVPQGFLADEQPLKKRLVADQKWDAEQQKWIGTGEGYITMPHGCISLWDGNPQYCSWYA